MNYFRGKKIGLRVATSTCHPWLLFFVELEFRLITGALSKENFIIDPCVSFDLTSTHEIWQTMTTLLEATAHPELYSF